MKPLKRKWLYTVGGLLLLALLVVGVQQIWAQQTSNLLSEEQIKEIVKVAYAGEIKSIELKKDGNPPQYLVQLSNAYGLYELHIHGSTGDILSLHQLNKATAKKPGKQGAKPDPNPGATPVPDSEATKPDPSDPSEPSQPGQPTTQQPPGSGQTGQPADPNTGQPTTPIKPGQQPKPPKETAITQEQAKQIAKGQFNGTLTSISLKQSGGKSYYAATLENSKQTVTIHINEADGKVLKKESKAKSNATDGNPKPVTPKPEQPKPVKPKPEKPKPEEQKPSKPTPITAAEAKAIALKEVSGTVKSVNKIDGGKKYEVEITSNGDDVKVFINAYSGAVIAFEVDDDDDNDDNDVDDADDDDNDY